MKRSEKISLLFLRVTLGWMFLYAGITQITTPNWSAAGYLQSAKTFTGLYQWLASSSLIGVINIVNEWGLFLLGVSLILGAAVRFSSKCGIALMALYYFVILQFPYPNAHSFIVDEHIIYISALLVLSALDAGKAWGIDGFMKKTRLR